MDLVMISGHYDLFPHTQWMLTHNSWVPDITVNGHINNFFAHIVCVWLRCFWYVAFLRIFHVYCWNWTAEHRPSWTILSWTVPSWTILSWTILSYFPVFCLWPAGVWESWIFQQGPTSILVVVGGGSCEVNMTICLNSAQISCKSLTTREVCHYKRHGDQQGAH